jgi:hypothetical protein
LLPDVWPEFDQDQCETMLAYMIKFGLVCALSKHENEDQTYVVPALLPLCADAAAVWPRGGAEVADVCSSVFFIHADGDWDDSTGFLPQGLFFSLVAALLHNVKYTKDTLKHLYRDRICVRGDQLFMVVLQPDDHRSELKVRSETPSDPVEVAAMITSHLEDGIAEKYGVQFHLEIKCSNCGELTSAEDERCSECASKMNSAIWSLKQLPKLAHGKYSKPAAGASRAVEASFMSCLDRPFVQLEVRKAVKRGKRFLRSLRRSGVGRLFLTTARCGPSMAGRSGSSY